MKRYIICGLTVASEIDLSMAAPEKTSGTDADIPDVFIRRTAVTTILPDARQAGPTWQVADQRIQLRVPGVARFRMTDGREIAFEAEAGSADPDLRIFLLGSAFGSLLHQRGALVLHAGAVAVNGQAVLFCGPSGAGKSSLVAALSAAGYPLITDDVCLVYADSSGRPMVVPDGRRLKLWGDAIERLSIGSDRDTAVRPGIAKYWVDPPTPALREAVPLRAIYFLRAEAPLHPAGIEPVNVLNALLLLRDNAYRPRLVRALGQEAEWLDRSVSIMRAGRAFHLTRRMSFDALPECIEGLKRHWETAGCTAAL